MNRALNLRAVWKVAVALGMASVCVSACGFKGPLVMPPEQVPVEQQKIDGAMHIAPVDASGMGVKK